MKLTVCYKDFSTKLKNLWDTSGKYFPPSILTNTVYFNGQIVGTVTDMARDKIEIETEDVHLKEAVETNKFFVTYATWLLDDYFSFVVLPLVDGIRRDRLKEYSIIRQNPRSVLYRLKIYGIDYCIEDMAADPSALFVYKEHHFREDTGMSQMFNESNKRVGYLLTVKDDYIIALVDKFFARRTRGDMYARFCVMGRTSDNGDYSVEKINRVELLRRSNIWRGRWADEVFSPGLKDGNTPIKYRG